MKTTPLLLNRSRILIGMTLAALACANAQGAQRAGEWSAQALPSGAQIERGRYLVKIGGCNDCHTPGYGASGGKVAEENWLTGDRLGWKGPWGTTYPGNLRLYMSRVTEQQWLDVARHQELRPPMPWFNLRAMSRRDLQAIYRFVRALGPKGEPAPPYVPPGSEPAGPVVRFPG